MEDENIVVEEIRCYTGGMPIPMPGNALNSLLKNEPKDTLDDFEITLQLNDIYLAVIDELYQKCKTEHDKI